MTLNNSFTTIKTTTSIENWTKSTTIATPSTTAITTPPKEPETTTIILIAGFSGGTIAGIVIGSLTGATLIGVGGYLLFKFLKKSKKIVPSTLQTIFLKNVFNFQIIISN